MFALRRLLFNSRINFKSDWGRFPLFLSSPRTAFNSGQWATKIVDRQKRSFYGSKSRRRIWDCGINRQFSAENFHKNFKFFFLKSDWFTSFMQKSDWFKILLKFRSKLSVENCRFVPLSQEFRDKNLFKRRRSRKIGEREPLCQCLPAR